MGVYSISRHASLLLFLISCGDWGLDPLAPDQVGNLTDSDSSAAPLSDTDPPILDALDPYRNEDLITVTGRAPEGDTVTVDVVGSQSTDEYLAIASDGTFSVDIGLERGVDVRITASNNNGVSEEISTQACNPWDIYEIDATSGDDYGDDCLSNPIRASEEFSDVQSVLSLVGNVLQKGDEDWYRVVTVDDPTIESNFGYENFNFEVSFAAGEGQYAFRVYRGSCEAESEECAGEEYDEYSFFAEDTEPDEQGSVPADSSACGGPIFNECADFSETYYIVVRRIDGQLNCDHYQLDLQNGTG